MLLIVDDTDSIRYAKIRILRNAGFEIAEARTGKEALIAISAVKPDLVVLDIHLPDIDGYEVCGRIKGDPQTSSIMVLHMSATYVDPSDTAKALEGGADACLTDPVEPAVLIATVRALLRLREAHFREWEARHEAEAANRAKDDFLAVLSHELRSPLNAIVTWTSLLQTGTVNREKTVEALRAVERNARLQAQLIDDLLDVSRISAGKLHLELQVTSLNEVVKAALDTIQRSARERNIEVKASLRDSGKILGDPSRLQQIISNLLSNAVKFTPSGGCIEVDLLRSGSMAKVTVRDNGIGIEYDLMPHIFERFRQGDSSTTRSQAGLGIGLTIASHLAELHRGTLAAESLGKGKGALFTLTLPLAPTDAAVPAPAKKSDGNADALLSGMRIFLVEDDEDQRKALATLLEQKGGAQVTTAGSVAEALRLIVQAEPDVLVSDIGMANQDGMLLMRRIREQERTRIGRLPAVALTGYVSAGDRKRTLDAGYDACLAKPINLPELFSILAQMRVAPSK